MDDKLELVVRSIRRTRNKLGCGFLLILALGVGLVYGGAVSNEGEPWIIVFGALCLVLAAIGGKIIWPNLRPEQAPLVQLLRDTPEKIAWLFSTPDPGPRGRTVTHTVHVCDTDGRRHTFMVKVAEVEGMLGVLKEFAPRATVGFSKETDEKYRRDPSSVLSDQ